MARAVFAATMKPRTHNAQHGCSSNSHSTDVARLSRPWPVSPYLESIVYQRVHKVLCAESDQLHPAKAYAHAHVLAAQPPQLLCLSRYAQQLVVAGGASFVQVVLGQLRRDLGGHRIRDKGATSEQSGDNCASADREGAVTHSPEQLLDTFSLLRILHILVWLRLISIACVMLCQSVLGLRNHAQGRSWV